MKIVPVEHGLEHILGKSTGVRGVGLHMSEIYGRLFEELEPKRYTGGTPDALRLEMGLAFESFLEEALKERLGSGGRPGEFVSEEGILYNPDLIIYNSHLRLGEIKLTWLSSREVPREPANGFPPKFEKYFVQMKSYCRCLETPYARLIGFFVNGDYNHKRGPLTPELLAWDLEFSKRELDENWQMMMAFAKKRRML